MGGCRDDHPQQQTGLDTCLCAIGLFAFGDCCVGARDIDFGSSSVRSSQEFGGPAQALPRTWIDGNVASGGEQMWRRIWFRIVPCFQFLCIGNLSKLALREAYFWVA